jgi:hypothetical protein
MNLCTAVERSTLHTHNRTCLRQPAGAYTYIAASEATCCAIGQYQGSMFEPIYILVRPLRGTNRRKGETVVGQTRQLNVYNQSSTVASKTSKRDAVVHASNVLCPCQTRFKLYIHTVVLPSYTSLNLDTVPSFGLQRKHGPAASRLMARAAGKSTFHHHLAQVSASASPSVYPPTGSRSVLATRFLLTSTSSRSSYHSKSPKSPNPTNLPTYPAAPPTTRPPPKHTDNQPDLSTTQHIRASPERSPTSCRSSSSSTACQTNPTLASSPPPPA